jgi:ubiquitin-large subunit ribosomal protein L40e
MLVVDLYENNEKVDFHESMINLFDIYDSGSNVQAMIDEIIKCFKIMCINIKCHKTIDNDCVIEEIDGCHFFYNTVNKKLYQAENLLVTDNHNRVNNAIADQSCSILLDPVTNSFAVKIYSVTNKQSNFAAMELYVKTGTGKIFTINTYEKAIGFELKKAIQDKEGIPPDQIRLIYSGKQIDDFVLVSNYGIKNYSTLYMILRLRGGMHHVSSSRNDYCSTRPYKDNTGNKILAKCISVSYLNKKDTTNTLDLIIHPRCSMRNVKQLIEIETNLSYFDENPADITDSVVTMLSTDALARYNTRCK